MFSMKIPHLIPILEPCQRSRANHPASVHGGVDLIPEWPCGICGGGGGIGTFFF